MKALPIPIEASDITHAIILVCAGDGNLTDYVQENLDGIEKYFRRFRLRSRESREARTGLPNFGVLALSDFYARDAEIHWYSRGSVSKWKIGEINTGDARGIAQFLAGALTALAGVRRLAIGFSGHGTGVLDEGRPRRTPPKEDQSGGSDIELDDGKVRGLTYQLERVGDDDDPVTGPETLQKIAELLRPKVPWKSLSDQSPSASTEIGSGGRGRKDWLTTLEVVEALETAREHSARTDKVDLLFFDSCFNGMIEVAYQCRDYAKAFIGSMNAAPRTLWDYGTWLQWMEANPPTDGYVWAGLALRAFQEAARLPVSRLLVPRLPDNAAHTWALTAVRTDKLQRVADAFRELVSVLYQEEERHPEVNDGCPQLKNVVTAALVAAQPYSGTSIRGVVDFAHQLEAKMRINGQPKSIEEIRQACRKLEQAVSRALVPPAPMVVIEPSTLDPRRVHGLAFWGPAYQDTFREDSENYKDLAFASTGWWKYLEAHL